MAYKDVTPPAGGKITDQQRKTERSRKPCIPFIRGDGTGPDIWAASERVFDAAVQKAYGGKRKVSWFEVFAGETSKKKFDNWLPDDTVEAFKEYLVGIKGPLTTPVGGGIRSLNVALRQMLDLYVCLRPVQYFQGVPSPVKHPEKVDMVIFRENTEEFTPASNTPAAHRKRKRCWTSWRKEFPKDFSKIRFGTQEKIADYMKLAAPAMTLPTVCRWASASSPCRMSGTIRLVKSAIEYALRHKRQSVTIVHKGNIMKFTEGAFRDWAYAAAERIFGDKVYTWANGSGPKRKRAKRPPTMSRRPPEGRRGSDQGRHCGHHPAAGAHAPGRFRRDRHAEPERRLSLRRAGGPGRRHRHRSRRQYQLRHRPRHFRSHPRHRAQICQPGQGESRQRGAERRNDVPLPGLGRSGGPDHQRSERRDHFQDASPMISPA